MTRPENEFRGFVGGFADPLARLAFLLTAGTDIDATALTNDALAQVRRRWRDAETTGAPETQAVEALLAALPRRRKVGSRPTAPDDARGLQSPGDGRVVAHVSTQVGVPVDSPAPTVDSPITPVVDARSDPAADADVGMDADTALLRDAIWTAWLTLAPRARVPMVLADASVASRRLGGIDVPESFGSARRQELIADEALRSLRARVVSDLPGRAGAESLPDHELIGLLDDTLREHAGSASGPIDPYPHVLEHVGLQRRRAATLVAVVVVVLAAAVAVAVRVSTPHKVTAAAAAAAASRSGFLPAPQVVPSAAGATQSSLSPQGPFGRPGGRPIGPLVVPWVPRGTAANDSILLANLTSYFTTVHTDAIGQTQVLLATDTPALRIAYVTANSSNGVIQSWFYGPVGSEDLIEGATSYGGTLLPDSVLADELVDPTGDTELVVIGPPDTTGMQLANFDFSKPLSPGFEQLPYQNGIAVQPLEPGFSPSTLILDVYVGTAKFELKDLTTVDLLPRFAGSITSNGPPAATPLPTPSVERGSPDPALVTEALQVAAAWEKPSPSIAAHPVVLWGGTDAAGTRLVVLRVDTQVVDLIVLEWSGDAPGLHGEILIHSTAPEVPVAFAYRALDGTRIGVIGSHGAVRAVLQFDGKVSAPVALNGGFASFKVTNPSPPPSNDGASDLDFVASVQLLDASGRVIATVPEPPSV
jgi:hypothetical protein